ncbi:MAG: hypothetical protein K2Y21_12200 [Phycisphaerales bacterium]|nr:hypothetical protein [Phycisphaerales bacterium]
MAREHAIVGVFVGLAMSVVSGTAVAATQTAVAPQANTFVTGFGRNLLAFGRVYQMIYDQSTLTIPVGSKITGVAWRMSDNGTTPYPLLNEEFFRLDIWMSSATRPAAAMSAGFDDNEGLDRVKARGGFYRLVSGTMPRAVAGPAPFGGVIAFTTPFVYKGGPLCMTIRSTSPVPAVSSATENNFDGTNVSGSAGKRALDDPDSVTGGNVGALVSLYTYRLPCPADLNNDDLVDDADFSIFVVAYDLLACSDPAMPAGCPSDLNRDGAVDDTDFSIFAAAYDALLCP